MERQLRIKGVRRKQIDEDKFAHALLLLAKAMQQESVDGADKRELPDATEAA